MIMFRDTDILSYSIYAHVNNGSQTCSWLDDIAMSDVLSESMVQPMMLIYVNSHCNHCENTC